MLLPHFPRCFAFLVALLACSSAQPQLFTQQGGKLVGSGAVGLSNQGISVALSADGNTGLEGGISDNSYVGAAWAFTRDSSEIGPVGEEARG